MRKYTHYELLGVRQDAAAIEIKKAFRQKVKLYHPDRTPGVDGSRFQAIVEAWDTLSDPWKRKIYDRELLKSARPKDLFQKSE
jgi:curved DNA-binding protein CbpA